MIPEQVGHRFRNEGAGAIIRRGDITTGHAGAASIWTIGIMDAAVGYGYYDIGIILAAANFAALMLRAVFPGRSLAPENPLSNVSRPLNRAPPD